MHSNVNEMLCMSHLDISLVAINHIHILMKSSCSLYYFISLAIFAFTIFLRSICFYSTLLACHTNIVAPRKKKKTWKEKIETITAMNENNCHETENTKENN